MKSYWCPELNTNPTSYIYKKYLTSIIQTTCNPTDALKFNDEASCVDWCKKNPGFHFHCVKHGETWL